ncbi:MAG: hypothetical protein J7K98_01050 [Candidatus Aenigmarchaeota archaeon]|nr:hypothetical protein [Candidatus Aenigmarchaeota archaeon]
MSRTNVKNEIEKLKDEFKIKHLQLEKRLTEVDLNLAKLKEFLKELKIEEVKGLAKRLEELEDISMVLNLALGEIKSKVGKIDEIDGLKSEVSSVEERLDKLEKNLQDTVQRVLSVLKEDVEKTRGRMEEVSKIVADLANRVSSLKKDLEILDIDVYMKQIEEINDKMARLETEIERLKSVETPEVIKKDLENLRLLVQNLSTKVLERDVKLKDLETSVNVLRAKIEEMDFINRINRITTSIKENEKRILVLDLRLNELKESMRKLMESVEERYKGMERIVKGARHIGLIQSLSKDMEEKLRTVENLKADIEEIASGTEKVFYEINKKLLEVQQVKDEQKRIYAYLDELKKRLEKPLQPSIPAELVNRIQKVERDIEEIRHLLSFLKSQQMPLQKIQELENRISRIENSRGIDMSPLLERIRQLEEKISVLESEIGSPKPIVIE